MRRLSIRIALALVLAFNTACRPFGIASGVTASHIRELVPGMDELNVRALLGDPLAIRDWGPDEQILDYAIETPLTHHSPTLWVLTRRGRVAEVQAKRSVLWRLDEEGLYIMRQDLKWESPAFSQTFR
jgi:hypothetical protein